MKDLPQNLAHESIAAEMTGTVTGSDHFKIARRERNESGTKSTISSDDAQSLSTSQKPTSGELNGHFYENAVIRP
jgi:hypothetical protein